ncbi:EpsG family protein [Chromobacterium violaceum]|uniref:EpsG family protein n=1 Tax=Chromobacterium violaceum TaxID=536 RepID=UPI0035A6C618
MDKVINVFEFFFILISLFLFSLGEGKRSHQSRKNICLTFSLIIIFFFGFRDVGLDIEPYKIIYENYSGFEDGNVLKMFSSMLEPMHAIVISVLKIFGIGFWCYLLIAAAMPMVIICLVVLKVDKYPILSLYFFVFAIAFPAMDAVRHFVAAGIYFGALYLLSTRRYWTYHGVTFISFLAHYSNAITLFLCPALKATWTLKSYIILLIGAFLCSVVSSELIKLMLDNLYEEGGGGPLLFKLNYYVNNTDQYEYLNNLHFWLLQVRSYFYLVFIIILNLYMLSKGSLFLQGKEFHRVVLNSQVVGTLIAVFLLGLGAREFAMRVNFLTSIGSFVLLADIVRHRGARTVIDAHKFLIVGAVLIIYNFIILLYLAGIHQPMSPFYLG